jgi:hypothetical protein
MESSQKERNSAEKDGRYNKRRGEEERNHEVFPPPQAWSKMTSSGERRERSTNLFFRWRLKSAPRFD